MTDKQYVVRFEPGGERLIVNANHAGTAMQKGEGLAALLEIRTNGNVGAWVATEADFTHEDNVYPAPLSEEEVTEQLEAQT